MENTELNLIPEDMEEKKPKFHYEPTYEATRQISIYDENGNQIGTKPRVKGRILKRVWVDEEELKKQRILELKAELVKVKEDIEQETFGLVRYDYETKKARACEIINELRVLEGKAPREINYKYV